MTKINETQIEVFPKKNYIILLNKKNLTHAIKCLRIYNFQLAKTKKKQKIARYFGPKEIQSFFLAKIVYVVKNVQLTSKEKLTSKCLRSC